MLLINRFIKSCCNSVLELMTSRNTKNIVYKNLDSNWQNSHLKIIYKNTNIKKGRI